jgi:UDP:flavonoid glycosyltransferase YjiC (YdhE family)
MFRATTHTGHGEPGLHIGVITSPVRGHIDPLLALASALHDRGCRVTFVHAADAGALIQGSTAGFRAVGARDYPAGALREYVRVLGGATGLVGTVRMVAATARLSDMLCREAPDALRELGVKIVLADVAEPAGALIARHLGLPFVGVITGLPLHPDPIVPPPYLGWLPDTSRRGRIRIGRVYRAAGVLMSPITRVLRRYARLWNIAGDPTQVLSPLLTVAQCPPGLDFPRSLPSPPIAWCGPFRAREEGDFGPPHDDGRPLIFCSLGTLQGGRYGALRMIAAACAEIGARAVIAHCGLLTEEQARSLPGDPLVHPFWPQRAVLRHARAAIVHGGFNTVLDCLSAGVPMVAVPIAFEQPGTSARLRAAGAAVVVPRRRMTRRSLRNALRKVLNEPSYARAAGGFAEQLRGADGAEMAAAHIVGACVRQP